MKPNIKETFYTLYKSFYVFLTYVLILQSIYLCSKFILTFTIKIKIFFLFSFWFSSFMTLWCYIKCLLKNPGTLSHSEITEENIIECNNKIEMCKKCNLLKIKRSHHCSACNKCIIKMDHHCMWINNCVGLYNQKYFILLNFYSLLMCLNCSFIIIYKIITCIKIQFNLKREICVISRMDIFLILLNAICSLIFGMLAFVMLVDQYCAIRTNTTGVEFLKKEKGEKKSFNELIIEVFGHSFSYLWFFPIDKNIKKKP
ncbi:palmitoyltransferase, putative [Plasmodium gallinaceum]|uniref:Palmitoyltransferase n=1 Tax=Plasmodium gallinaceum TaxID=5849 RepID=A0A1J1GPD6_PLAGA|nr:palmitoyltransferase, putative [Plasmodium gallinaceum]CRG94361.1 palmitoyltransferase, putative [Plasmodium gallinaceum]